MSKQVGIIIYEGKHGDCYWIADNREQIRAALRELFVMLDGDGCYADVAPDIAARLSDARAGDFKAMYYILRARQGYEYEGWREDTATDATVPEKST